LWDPLSVDPGGRERERELSLEQNPFLGSSALLFMAHISVVSMSDKKGEPEWRARFTIFTKFLIKNPANFYLVQLSGIFLFSCPLT
jgi:hypothetical protein